MRRSEWLYLSDKLDMLDERLDSMQIDLAIQKSNIVRIKDLEDSVEELNSFKSATKGIVAFLAFIIGSVGVVELFKK